MEKLLFTLSFGFAALILATQAGWAEPGCAPRAKVLEALAQTFGETRRSIGLVANAQVMEVFASAETGTWTLIFTRPDGLACVIASGKAYEAVREPLLAKGSPA